MNLLATGVLLECPLRADCIPSASSMLRLPISLGSIIMSLHIPFLARTLLMPNIVKISIVVNVTVAMVFLVKQLIKLMGLINCIILMVAYLNKIMS